MRSLPVRASLAVALSLAAIGCTTTTTTTFAEPVQAEPGVVRGPVPAPLFPECGAGPFAFVGETSLAAIGLAHLVSPAEANVVGTVWITAGPVPISGPLGPGDRGDQTSDGRMLCIEFPDGSGMSTTIDDAWQPPGVEMVETTTPAWPVIGGVAVIVLLLGASFVAFRRG